MKYVYGTLKLINVMNLLCGACFFMLPTFSGQSFTADTVPLLPLRGWATLMIGVSLIYTTAYFATYEVLKSKGVNP